MGLKVRIRVDAVLHSSSPPGGTEIIRAWHQVIPGQVPQGHHPMTFFLEQRMLPEERSVRECCVERVSIRCS